MPCNPPPGHLGPHPGSTNPPDLQGLPRMGVTFLGSFSAVIYVFTFPSKPEAWLCPRS